MNILNFCSTANDNAITEHTEAALCKKLKTAHPHDIVELNDDETIPSHRSTRHGCEEVCAYCYGTDNNLSFTRLIRCKDCQCSFHLECMRAISNEEDTSTCEPSCCYKCDELQKDSVLSAAFYLCHPLCDHYLWLKTEHTWNGSPQSLCWRRQWMTRTSCA